MFWVSRIFELLSATKKLNTAKVHVMSAVSGLTVVILLGMFATFLSAVMIAGFLWLIFIQLIGAGLSPLLAALLTATITLLILSLVAVIAVRVFERIRHDVEQIFHSQAPIVAPVVDKATNVAGAFFQGLRTSRKNDRKDKSQR